jgi:NAD(P)-dependent dehydrogenase (short-subunit alcohol dehydrogenase family)
MRGFVDIFNVCMNFENRTVIVTGGGGALGSVLVRRFLDVGARVAVPHHGKERPAALPAAVFARPADLTDATDVDGFARDAIASFGPIDILVNAAGGYEGGSRIEETSVGEWENMLNLNARTAFLMSRAVLPEMRRNRFGRIISIAAMPALRPAARKGAYAVSKRAVITLTETIAEEVKGSGVTANAIAPGIILTEANRQSMPDADVGRWVTPGEIASVVLFLASEDARSVNGTTLTMFGGI